MMLSKFRNLLLFILDMMCAVASFGFAYYFTRVELTVPVFLSCLGLLILVYGAVLFGFGIYRSLWRCAQSNEFFLINVASLVAGALYFLICRIFIREEILPLFFYLLNLLTISTVLVSMRLVYRVYRDVLSRRGRREAVRRGLLQRRTMIVGAGSACRRLMEELQTSMASTMHPVVLVDDDPEMTGHLIMGTPVGGTTREIKRLAKEYDVELIVIAIPSATNEMRARIIERCNDTGCSVKILPRMSEITDSSMLMRLRDISMDELLGREPIVSDDAALLDYVSGKTVMITGGGGSIGSELARQTAAQKPAHLILLDIYENNAYAIQQELIRQYGDSLKLTVLIGSVRDKYWVYKTMREFSPDILFHAAAHKHVPLMEVSPAEAVKNNILGTWNTARAAAEAGVSAFVLISTDKAVNPTNIMGATKRVCEMIIQAMSGTCATKFVAVRFGNVLGSNGSVIPLFKQQIEEGGPVTVTHPDIIRYFMTIPEAAQLVMTAASMGEGGEIFVLDMGSPVKLDDLARKMIRLAGLVPDRDIPIVYTGLRPGEKLYEELLMGEEGLRMTPNRKIFIGNPTPVDRDAFFIQLDTLKQYIYGLDRDENADRISTVHAVEARLMEMVPTFRRTPVEQEREA
ncbi:MAG: polysaccharide biosynthesis protein [Clostridia bacterium]|nr:polysaccharide biosynthesis protein [Clostridia bacterium]